RFARFGLDVDPVLLVLRDEVAAEVLVVDVERDLLRLPGAEPDRPVQRVPRRYELLCGRRPGPLGRPVERDTQVGGLVALVHVPSAATGRVGAPVAEVAALEVAVRHL